MVRSIVVLAAAASLLVGSEVVTAAASPSSHRAGPHAVRLVRRTNPQEHAFKGYCKPRRSAVNQGNDTAAAVVPQPQLGGTETVQLLPVETMPMHSGAQASSSMNQPEATSQAPVSSVTFSRGAVTSSIAPASSAVASSGNPSDAAGTEVDDAATTEYVDITSFVTVTPSSTVVSAASTKSLPGAHSSSGTPSSQGASSNSSSSSSPDSDSTTGSTSMSSGAASGTSTRSSSVASSAPGQPSSSSHGSSTSASPTSSSSSSTSSSSTSIASNASSTTLASSTPASSIAANSTTHPSSSAPASSSTSKLSSGVVSSSTSSSAAPSATPSNGCPAGTSFKVVTDDFARLDDSKWTLEAGAAKLSKFSSAGLTMQLDEQNQFIVYQSVSRWAPPTKMSVGIQSSSAPGIVSAMTFLAEAGVTDEIDLELIEGSWQVPMWHDGHRLEFGKDVQGTLAQGTSRNLSSWVYDDNKMVPFAKVHEWEVDWKKDSLAWSADGRKLLDIKKLPKGNFVTQTLPVRFGPWVAGSWAGQVDWKKNPNPSMKITKMTIQGCQAD